MCNNFECLINDSPTLHLSVFHQLKGEIIKKIIIYKLLLRRKSGELAGGGGGWLESRGWFVVGVWLLLGRIVLLLLRGEEVSEEIK